MASDPRRPLLIGIIVLAALMLGGIVWAVAFLPSDKSFGSYDANVSFNDANDPVSGPSNAKVTLRIFEDFECPACKIASQGVDYVRKTYGDKVRVVWNDFPLEMHANARAAANAARCAEEQGKFWEYADALYGAQETWGPKSDPTSDFIAYAKQLGMNDAAFGECLTANRFDGKIANDLKEGIADRVDVTPTFFLNQTRLTGALSPADWDREIQRALGSSK